MLFVNCLAWVMYGLLIRNYYIFSPNVVGINFTLFYTLSVFHLATESKRNRVRNTLLVGISFVLLGSLACFVTLVPYDPNGTLSKKVSGMIAVMALIVFYTSPLADMAGVIKKKDASSISFGMAIANGINGLLWTAYGFAIDDIVSFNSL
jgi:solute carrier family 50 protein (sugar transporter)